MFSGIIEEFGVVERLEKEQLFLKSSLFLDCSLGDSIAVSGACLTVAEKDKELVRFDLSTETLQKTILGELEIGSLVNLERALLVGGRLDGHFVLGHVDTKIELLEIEEKPNTKVCWFSLPETCSELITEKGSVCIDGISLTVGEVLNDRFNVYLIPFTLDKTTLSKKQIGESFNFEADCLARYAKGILKNGK